MPQNHIKPTSEELEAQTQAAIAEAEKLSTEPPVEEDVELTPNPDPQAALEEVETPEPTEAEPSEEDKAAIQAKLDAEKKKTSASARENQKIYAKNRVINQALTEADEIPEPTDEEMAKSYQGWDEMSEIEKTLAKETVVSRNWRKVISTAKEQATKIEKWNDSVDEFVDNPQTFLDNPELEGKQDAFREFATSEANNSVPFKVLISAFLHEQSTTTKPNKGKMFENGSGGPNEKPQPKNGKITLEEARSLRERDYSKWKEYLAAGKIESNL